MSIIIFYRLNYQKQVMRIVGCFFLLLIVLPLAAGNSNAPLFNELIKIDQNNTDLINDDLTRSDYEKLFYYYVLVSGGLQHYPRYKTWFFELEKQIEKKILADFNHLKIINLSENDQQKFSEKLLIYLHQLIFKKYDFMANLISDVVQEGRFNCVSSSILYMIFLTKYQIKSQSIETHDHVFIQVNLNDSLIDVETTNQYGFNPGSNKKVLDDFGKMTGFTYVPAKDYQNRHTIPNKLLYFIVYHNLATDYYQKKDYLKAIKFSYLVKNGRRDEKSMYNFKALFHHYLIELKNQKKYALSIELLDSYVTHFGLDEHFKNFRFALLAEIIQNWKVDQEIEKMKNFLTAENKRFAALENDRRFYEVYYNFVSKLVIDYNRKKLFKEALNEIAEFEQINSFKENENLFEYTLDHINNYYDLEQKDFHQTDQLIDYAQQLIPRFHALVLKYKKRHIINRINYLVDQKNYALALAELKKNLLEYTNDRNLLILLKNVYVKYTIHYYDQKDFEKTIFYCEEALKKFPGDMTLTNNYRSFFQNFINEQFKQSNYSKARQILQMALEKFPNYSYFIQFDRRLLQKNY